MNFLNMFYSKTVDDKKEVTKYDAIAGLLHLKCNSISKTYEFRIFGIKRLIRQDKISDCSIVGVLIGAETYKRKHVYVDNSSIQFNRNK